MAKKTIMFRLDAGPTITFLNPGMSEPFKSQVVIDLEVTDSIANISDVQLAIGEVDLMLENPAAGSYTATLVFNDPRFTPPLNGDQLLTARASNDNGNSSVVVRRFVVDNEGPEITNMVPGPGELIGGVIELSAIVVDPAGRRPVPSRD